MMEVSVVRYVTIRKAAQITGYSENAIRTKINTGVWPENMVWKWGEDSVQLIILEGYDKWAKLPGKASRRGRRPSSSTFAGTESDTRKD